MITILHRGGYAQKITILHREGGVFQDPQKWLRNLWMTPYGQFKTKLAKKRKGISNRYIPKAKRCMLHSILFAGFVSPDFDQQKKDTVALLSYLLSNALCGNDDLQWAGTWITLMGLRAAPQYKTIQEPVDVPCTQLVGEQQSYQSIFFVLQHLINVGTLLYNGQGRGQTLQVMKT